MPKMAAEKQFSVQIFEKCFSILICGHYMMIIINWFRKNIVELSTISRIFFPFLSEIIEVNLSYVTEITGVYVPTSHLKSSPKQSSFFEPASQAVFRRNKFNIHQKHSLLTSSSKENVKNFRKQVNANRALMIIPETGSYRWRFTHAQKIRQVHSFHHRIRYVLCFTQSKTAKFSIYHNAILRKYTR